MAESSRIAEALTRHVAGDGRFRLLAEIGPASAAVVSAMAGAGDEEWEALYGSAPFSIPFFWFKEDVAWLRAFPAAEAPVVWGIDQEFILSPQLHLGRLARDGSAAMRPVAQALLGDERAAYARIVSQRRPTGTGHLLEVGTPALDRLAAVASGEEKALVRALQDSFAIYDLYAQGRGHDNNQRRAEYMRKQLRDHLWALPGGPAQARLVGKFGANHVQRGHSVLGVDDIGNFLSQVADLTGQSSLHVLVLPVGGQRNFVLPFTGSAAAGTPVDCAGLGHFRPLCEAAGPVQGWQAADLRPLRAQSRRLAAVDPALPGLVRSFDWVIFVGEATPATMWDANLRAAD